ncbi:hypothetical protein SAMN02990966_07455 [Rhodospirillales bacterium URHD0017]|nr:hypothetical protein SAMN02990966_07455 [Rhodospirillales bacterium URHD0017]
MYPPDAGTPQWLQNYRAAQKTPETKSITVATGPGSARWVKGMPSPNPKGRPPGIRERKAKITERLLDQAGAVIDVMLEKALEGDAAAAALVVNRVLPVLRPQSEKVTFTLNADASISKQVEQVLVAISQGEVAPDVGKKIIEAVQSLANVRAVEDLEQRIMMLEARTL